MRRHALLLPLCVVLAGAAPVSDRERPLREAVWAGRWLEGVRLYDALKDAEPSPQASYLAGLAQWRLRRPEEARPPLEKAAAGGFRAGGGRPQPADLLAKIDAYDKLHPARLEVRGLDAALLEVYSEERTPLTGPVIDGLPRIAAIGKRLFGEPPPLRFFLFARLPRFTEFFAVFADPADRNAGSAHSTGVVNMVIFCEEKAHRGTTDETVSLALHEAMHAWAATYLRKKYDRPIFLPPYVDEGLVTYAAGLWSPQVAALPAPRLARWRAGGRELPSLEALRRHESFYEPGLAVRNYLVAEQLIERLIGPPDQGAEKIKAFLDAYAQSGDDVKAWRVVSGKDAAAEYAALVSAK